MVTQTSVVYVTDTRYGQNAWHDPSARHRCYHFADALVAESWKSAVIHIEQISENLLAKFDHIIFHRPKYSRRFVKALEMCRRCDVVVHADYDDLKARAEKVGELEQKVQGFEAAAARTALVSKVAKDTGVDADILADLRADSEDELTALASKLRDRFKPTAPHIPGQDKRPDNAPQDPLREMAGKLFNRS